MSVQDENPSSVMLSTIRRFLEVVVLSVYNLVWIIILIHDPNIWKNFHSKNHGTLVNLSSENNVQPDRYARISKLFQVDSLFRSSKGATLTSIGVYSSPLSGPFSSSTPSVRDYIQRQYFPVDFHAFVVFETSDGMWWALDKMTDGIYVSRGSNHDSVLFYFQYKPRPKPILMFVKDESNSSVSDLVRRLKHLLKSNKYDIIDKNCQHFSKEIFDKFAIDHTWDFTTLTDFTSPLTLFRNGGVMSLILLFCTIFFYELYNLYKEGIQTESYHYKYVPFIIISVLFVTLLFLNDVQRMCKEFIDLTIFKYHMASVVILVEAVVTAPLDAIRRRGRQYAKMWKSGNIFNKIVWLPLCYAIIYTYLTYVFLVWVQMYRIISFFDLIDTDISDISSVNVYLFEIAYWLMSLGSIESIWMFLVWYIPTLMYLSLQ